MELRYYQDNFDFVNDLDSLINDLKNSGKTYSEITEILKEAYNSNKKSLSDLKKLNIRLLEQKKNKESFDVGKVYKKEKKEKIIKKKEIVIKDSIDYYITYIENNTNYAKYLEILPTINTDSNINIINRILAHYLKEINEINNMLIKENNQEEIEYLSDLLVLYTDIFNSILDYRDKLLCSNIDFNEKDIKTKEKVVGGNYDVNR